MSDYIGDLVERYRRLGVLVDTNLLLLYFVGLYNPTKIETFKKTGKYQRQDFDILVKVLKNFPSHYTTPNILTEVSNLAGQLGEGKSASFFAKVFSPALKILKEEYVPSCDLASSSDLPRFGLTDSGIVRVAKGKYLLLTDDFRLAQWYASQGGDVVNFNHIRPLGWKR